MNAIDINRDRISESERKRYAKLQGVCCLLFGACMAVLALDVSWWVKVAFAAGGVISMLGGVVFNYARRFGIRVLWSSRFRT